MCHTHIHTLSICNPNVNASHKYNVNTQPHHECATRIHTKSCDIQDPNKCWRVTCIEGKTFVYTRHDVIKQFGVYRLRQSVATSSSLVWFQRDSIRKTNETEALNGYQILIEFSGYALRQQTLWEASRELNKEVSKQNNSFRYILSGLNIFQKELNFVRPHELHNKYSKTMV